jgi:WD40 repeat protein
VNISHCRSGSILKSALDASPLACRSNMVAVACAAPQLVQIWDCRQAPDHVAAVMTCDLPVRTGNAHHPHDDSDSIYCVSSVPSSPSVIPSQLLLGSKCGRLHLWDLRNASVLWTVAQLSDKVLGCAASPCGRRVVAASRAGQV